MKKYSYFEVPTQVRFWDYKNGRYHGGIAYRDEIICGCCGGMFNINKIYESASDTLKEDPIIVFDSWERFSSVIFGEGYDS